MSSVIFTMIGAERFALARRHRHLGDVSMKTPLVLVVPGALVLGATAAALMVAADAPLLVQAGRGYPYVAVAAALLIAWRMERSRLFAAALVLALTFVVLQPFVLGDDVLASALFVAFLPPGFALLAFARDAGFTAASVRNHALLCLAPLTVAAFFSAGNPPGTAAFLVSAYGGVPVFGILAILSLVAASIAALRTQRATEAGLAWLTVACAFALAAPAASTTRAVWVLAGALVLIVALVETAYAMAYHDELTGLPGRRALAQARSSLQAPYAIAIVDVDHFKDFNDTHGHDVGDQVLCMVAAKLRAVGGGGKAFRTGGEEFTLVFAGLGKREALPYAEEVREAVESAVFTLRGSSRPRGTKGAAARGKSDHAAQRLQVTVSVGVASPTARSAGVDAVIKSADQAMYRAKTEGRNRVAV